MPVRRRLALYGTGVAAAGMFLFIVLLSGLGGNSTRENQDRGLTALADSAAAALERGEVSPTAGRPFVVVDAKTSTEPFLLVLAADGSVRYASGLVDGAPPRIPAAVVVEANDRGRSLATLTVSPAPSPGAEPLALRVAARPWSRGDDGGIVVAAQSTAFVTDQIAGLRAFLIISAIITLVVVAIVSWLVAGRAVRPLVSLAETTGVIGSTGDLSKRISLGTSHDEVGRLTTSFNAMLDRLQAAQSELAATLAAQQRFVADASHELRTPLATIRTNAEFLRERADASEADRAEALADVVTEAERMSRLVDGLLVLARSDAGAKTDRRPVDLRAIAADEARRARPPHAGDDVRVTSDGAALVSGDPDALGRVVRILLDNALRHGRAPVGVAVRAQDGRVRLEVRDAGPGFATGTEDRVFDRFYRGDAARTGEGSGLGLSIARAIVEAHGGTIRASTPTGGGAVVSIELPAL